MYCYSVTMQQSLQRIWACLWEGFDFHTRLHAYVWKDPQYRMIWNSVEILTLWAESLCIFQDSNWDLQFNLKAQWSGWSSLTSWIFNLFKLFNLQVFIISSISKKNQIAMLKWIINVYYLFSFFCAIFFFVLVLKPKVYSLYFCDVCYCIEISLFQFLEISLFFVIISHTVFTALPAPPSFKCTSSDLLAVCFQTLF